MSEPASISASIAQRYASAIFDLASEGKALDALESDIAALEAALKESEELRNLVFSPLYSRAEQEKAITAVARALGLGVTMTNTLGLMAERRRLFVLPQLLVALRERIAEAKGIVTAEVRAAKALTKAQQDKLAKALREAIGKDVNIELAVDESLIGGLVVKVGSQMVDTSIAAKLANLQNAMKEVG
ncbi:MAG: F0F1 ATP synthase subunit delta [Alphaproteobacteria bacterium]|nr:MAG: F0F1 ATP synthase subunit delta [Alphaproteobacteria bacterium]